MLAALLPRGWMSAVIGVFDALRIGVVVPIDGGDGS